MVRKTLIFTSGLYLAVQINSFWKLTSEGHGPVEVKKSRKVDGESQCLLNLI